MADAQTTQDRFEREYGCTVTEWQRWMPSATAGHVLESTTATASTLRVALAEGHLELSWQVLPERVIALIRLPRLRVQFHFNGVAAPARAAFMRRFDLVLQRGGG